MPARGAMLPGIGAAIMLKLTSSIDDVLWLAPFLTRRERKVAKLRNAAIYVGVCLAQTLVATAIACSGDSLVSDLTKHIPGAWTSQRILTVGAAGLLSLYTLKLGVEYFHGDGEKESSETGERPQPQPQEENGVEAPNASDLTQELVEVEVAQNESGRSRALFMVAFLGSVDDLTLYVPMLVGKEMDLIELLIGGFVAASAIVLLCVFVGLCRPIAKCISSVPLVCIVGAFAVMLLIKGFCFAG